VINIIKLLLICTFIYSCSKQNGTVYIKGLKGPVYIIRDSNGVPHITATTNNNDVFVGLGYIHAQDRFWQMEYQRRIASGRLSEIFGAETIKEDKFLHTWGFYRSTVAEWSHLNQPTKDSVSAYTSGVNAFIAENNFPLQIKILRYKPEKWSNYDSIVWQKMMAFNLQNSWITKLDNLAIAESQGESKISQFYPPYPQNAPTILSNADLIQSNLPTVDKYLSSESFNPVHKKYMITEAKQIIQRLGFEPFAAKGSNSWVVSGKMTKSGKPLLANDTHLQLSSPTLWYLAELKGPTLHVTGATIPGFPGVIIGHNDHITWGVTAAYNDVQDLFYISPTTKTHTIVEKIKIKESDTIDYKIILSQHGPVISTDNSAIESMGPNLHLAIQWPALESDDTTVQSMLQLQYANNWDQFTTALGDFVAPSQNFIYADTLGNIGYFLPGRLPIRHGFSGEFPVSESLNWAGYIPLKEHPQVYNPPEGFIVSANNKITPDSYKYSLANRFDAAPYRAERIIDLITKNGKLDKTQFENFQQDSMSYLWRNISPVLLTTKPLDNNSKKALEILAKWDGNCTTNSIGATIFAYWLQQFKPLVPYKSTFGAAALPTYQYLKTTLANPSQAKFLSTSLSLAINKLTQEQDNWQWGAVHKAYFKELALGQSKLLGFIWERSIATPGAYDTVNVGAYNSKTLNQIYGATYRQVIDLSSLESSSYIYPMGQSENVFSDNYANLLKKWADGKYITIKNNNAPCNPKNDNCILLLPG
jgi:penicillin amidase